MSVSVSLNHAFAIVLLLGLPGLVPSARADVPGYESDVRGYNLAHGRVVFTDKCLACHETGRRGAPVFGATEEWQQRLQQPLDTLIAHAVDGHGRMPARGDQEISEQDVAAAVAFVVHRTRALAALEGEELPAPPAGTPADSADEAVLQMFMMLIGRERWR